VTADASAVAVRDNPDEKRYEVTLDGAVAGFTVYRTRPGLIAFVHTEIDERLEGRGLGSALIRGALDDAREKGMAVLPFCPFVNDFIVRHAEYRELVPEDYREGFGL
jgi:predicted GNAT family acetyltransferase